LLRFARIAPLLVLLIAILSVLHLAQFKDFVIADIKGGLLHAIFATLTFQVNVLEATRGYLPGNWDILWSLSIEEMFYLFFPLFCCFFGRGKLLIAILFAFIVLGPFARTVFAYNEVWQEYSYLGGMDAIAFGCLTAMFVKHMRFSTTMLRIFACMGSAILILILTHIANIQWLQSSGLDMTLIAIGTCMMIIAAAQTQWKSPRLLHPLRMLGQRSYEIYLTHMFVVYALFNTFVILGKPMLAVPVLFVAVIVIAGVLGDGVARFYSDPFNRWLRHSRVDQPAGVTQTI
jgi:peptidoglycan/LPS O-acetylase OafA/YrhL